MWENSQNFGPQILLIVTLRVTIQCQWRWISKILKRYNVLVWIYLHISASLISQKQDHDKSYSPGFRKPLPAFFFVLFSKTMGELKSYFVTFHLENFCQCWWATEVHVYSLSMVLRLELFEQLKCIQQINQDTTGCQQNNHTVLPRQITFKFRNKKL